MNFCNFIHIFIVVVCIASNGYTSYAQDYQIKYLSVEDGLSHNEVTSIIQDNYGFMWFGTRGGLNRYDGYQFKHYKPNREQISSIQDASVECLFRDSGGRLWIGTQSGGYSYYDPDKDCFVVPSGSAIIKNKPVSSFDEDSKGNIYISSLGQGIVKYMPVEDKYEKLKDGFCRTVTCISDTMIFWGTQFGLSYLKYDNSEGNINFKKGYHDPVKIVVDRHHPKIWIVGHRLELISYNYSNGEMERFVIPCMQKELVAGISMIQDMDGNIWIGTKGLGLYKFNIESSLFCQVDINPELLNSCNRDYDVILDLFQDKTGDIWVGTDGGGIVKLSNKNQFYTYGQKSLIGGQHITAVLEDRDGVLWIGTKGEGLFMRDKLGQFIKINAPPLFGVNPFESKYVRCIYQSGDGLIWVGLESNLFVIQKNNKGSLELVQAAIYHRSPHLSVKKAIYIVEAGKQLWVATEMNGLFLFEKTRDNYERKKRFHAEYEGNLASTSGLVLNYDNRKRLWVGTKEGLHLYQDDKESFTAVRSLISNPVFPFDNDVLCLYTDKSGDVWYGTPSSANQLIEGADESFNLKVYTKEDGLPDDYINTILSDNKGNIWLSTNAGLSMYNKERRTFRNYDMSDGLGGLNFSKASGCVGHNGQMYFGGFSSMTYFNPEEVTENQYNPPVAITEFKILNKPSVVNAKGGLIKSINAQQRILLNHQQNEFSIEFSALDYKAPHLNQYAYWLEGHDSLRVFLGNRRYVSFSNLKPGDYTLHLYGTNSNGIWSDQHRSLNISISPPPWKTWYASGAYVLLIVLTVFVIVKVVRRQEQLKQEVQIQITQRENQKKLNEDKLRFFTNISHEIRTPLTLILAPVSELLQKDFSKLGCNFIKDKVELVHQNATKLLALVNQLLEFRRLEVQKVQLQASEGNIIAFISQLCQPFDAYAESKHILFKKEYKVKDVFLHFDDEKMATIINNLLSNAFKFAGKPGKVTVQVEEHDDAHIFISITNNGKGISSSEIKFLFERFYHGAHQSSMDCSGIGLSLVKGYVELHKGEIEVDSVPGKSTTFTLKLLKGKKHLLADELNTRPTKLKYHEGVIGKKPGEVLLKPKKSTKGATVLIIEDDEDIQRYLKEFLGNYFNVIVAKDGLEGFDTLIEYMPELVISDVMMPCMDGFELCHKIKSNPHVSHIPVILLTAKGKTSEQVRGTRLGADAYLTKPFDTNLLLEKMNMLIESRRKLSEKYASKLILAPKDQVLERDDAKFIKKLMAIVEENIGNIDFSQQQLALKMAMSGTTLYRKCKKITRLAPSAFIKMMRLKRAAQLLRDTDLTVTEIMDGVAYLEIKTFRRNFTVEFKMSPSEYRKQHRD